MSQTNIKSFSKLCDTIDFLLTDKLATMKSPHLQLRKGCIVVCSDKATNGRFILVLFNADRTTVVDRKYIANLGELFDTLSEWNDY